MKKEICTVTKEFDVDGKLISHKEVKVTEYIEDPSLTYITPQYPPWETTYGTAIRREV